MHDCKRTRAQLPITMCIAAAMAVAGALATPANASPLLMGKALVQPTTTETEVVPARWHWWPWHRHHRHAWLYVGPRRHFAWHRYHGGYYHYGLYRGW